MATLKDIRKRIVSVKNTQKITKAMKMVAAAKLRRAQTRLIQARPYAAQIEEFLSQIASLVERPPPVLQGRGKVATAEFLILTSDRGLCGGFNGNLLRRIEEFLKTGEKKYEVARIRLVGKKGRDFFKARRRAVDDVETGIYDTFTFNQALGMAKGILKGFEEERFDEFFLVYNRFKSAITQEIRIIRILPIEPAKQLRYVPEYIYEPSRDELLEKLIPQAVGAMIFRAVLESMAGEQGARMAAMENATNNCSDMIYRLTLALNRARQAAITKELMDIVNGAEALK